MELDGSWCQGNLLLDPFLNYLNTVHALRLYFLNIYKIELGYIVKKGKEYFASLRLRVGLTEELCCG